jgi:hypothetical protein
VSLSLFPLSLSLIRLAALPFLVRTELLLAPLLVLLTGYVVSLLGLNVAKGALETYFGS